MLVEITLLLLVIVYILYQPKEKEETIHLKQQSMNGSLRNEVLYDSENIHIAFPQFIEDGSKELETWNRYIKEDVKKILGIYGVEYNIDSTEGNPLQVPELVSYLNLYYEVMQHSENFFSVLYFVDFFAQAGAYPTTSPYSTNLDLINNRRIQLKQKVSVNESFLREFNRWRFIDLQGGDQTIENESRQYLAQLGDDLLLQGFQNADIIGSGNPLGIYSYYRDDTIGIAISLPHYLGGFGLFEKP